MEALADSDPVSDTSWGRMTSVIASDAVSSHFGGTCKAWSSRTTSLVRPPRSSRRPCLCQWSGSCLRHLHSCCLQGSGRYQCWALLHHEAEKNDIPSKKGSSILIEAIRWLKAIKSLSSIRRGWMLHEAWNAFRRRGRLHPFWCSRPPRLCSSRAGSDWW